MAKQVTDQINAIRQAMEVSTRVHDQLETLTEQLKMTHKQKTRVAQHQVAEYRSEAHDEIGDIGIDHNNIIDQMQGVGISRSETLPEPHEIVNGASQSMLEQALDQFEDFYTAIQTLVVELKVFRSSRVLWNITIGVIILVIGLIIMIILK